MNGLRIDVADLLAHAGARRDVSVEAVVEGLEGSGSRIEAPVALALGLERISEGIVVRGTLRATWQAQCSACLADLAEPLAVTVDELFEVSPIEGETYPIDGHEIDLEQLVRDSLLLELPLAPRCADGCADPVVVAEPAEPSVDPRWDALAALDLEVSSSD